MLGLLHCGGFLFFKRAFFQNFLQNYTLILVLLLRLVVILVFQIIWEGSNLLFSEQESFLVSVASEEKFGMVVCFGQHDDQVNLDANRDNHNYKPS